MGLADDEAEHALALGRRNAQVIELFGRYCANVRVEAMGGTGMLEAATGLPIGHRAFRCAYAPGSVQYAADLEEAAVEFYEQHCRGCGDRVRTGLLGENIAMLAEARRTARDVRIAREAVEKGERQRQREDRAARRARRRVGEPYQTVRQLECVDRLDAADGSPDAADIEELVRTASLGPEIISAATTAELVELAQDAQAPWAIREAAQAVLVPLTSAGYVPDETAAEIALASLAEGPGTQAGRLLVTAADAILAESVTGSVARSAVELAGHTGDPVARVMSRFSSRAVTADPAPLLLCAERNAEAVLQAVERMLASASQEPPAVLVGPDGQPLGSPPETTEFPGAADRSRSIAAVACLPLIEAMPAMAPRLVGALARSLESPDRDRYDAPPSRMAGMTLGQGLLRRYDEVASAVLAAAPRVSAEARKSLFAAISSALHSAGDSQLPDPASLSRLVQFAVDRLQGDWGEEVSTEAALTLRDEARFHPERLAGHADALVGGLIIEITRPAGSASGLAVPGNAPQSGVEALGRRQRRATRISCLEQAIGYLVEAGADDAVGALFSLLDTEDDSSSDAVSVRASATRLLGKIGSRPAHLPAVVPRLYTGLLHTQDKVRRAAVHSWTHLAGQPQPLPSTLLDLLPALLDDAPVAVSALQLIDRLDIPTERRPELLELVSRLSHNAYRAALINPEQTIASCVKALRSLAFGLSDREAEEPAGLALVISDRLSSYDLRDLLLSWWPPRLANSGLFAVRALSVLADPELADYFNMRDYRVQAALLACPYGTSIQPPDSFVPAADFHLPDHPWPALEMIEVLQRAGRWDDAADIARHIHAAIPGTPEHKARADLTAVIAELAAGEALPRTGTVPAVPATPAQSGRSLDDILSRYTAAADARRALHEASHQPAQGLVELADRLEQAAEAIQPTQSPAPVLPTETAWTAWADALRSLAHLMRWDAAVQDASDNADRHLLAARRRAEVALAGMPADHASDPLLQAVGVLSARIAAVQQPGDTARLARELASIPLPVRIIEERSRRYQPPAPSGEGAQEPAPAVGICRLDGALVTNAHVLRPDEVHDLSLELRLTEWPDHATAIEVTFLSVLSPSQVRLPSFAFTRTLPDDDGVYRLSATGSLSVSFTLPAGAPPQAFPIAARFTGPDLDKVLPVAGHSELRLRPFDATTDALTNRPQLDERIVTMYSVLHGMDLNADDVQAFCRLYTAIVDKAVAMQYEGTYMNKGSGVTERVFHNDMFDRLLSDPALEGRVQRGTRAAGGFLDIIHDRINAELKVAKKTSVTVKTSHKYLGQPTDYAADTGSQLSILVVLDMTRKQSPPGVLENYLGLMRPAVDGFDDPQFPSDDPRFPSIVGVVIIKANLPVPSAYSRGTGGPASPIEP